MLKWVTVGDRIRVGGFQLDSKLEDSMCVGSVESIPMVGSELTRKDSVGGIPQAWLD